MDIAARVYATWYREPIGYKSMKLILLVEDDESTASFIAAALRREGYAVTLCSTAEEASQHAESELGSTC